MSALEEKIQKIEELNKKISMLNTLNSQMKIAESTMPGKISYIAFYDSNFFHGYPISRRDVKIIHEMLIKKAKENITKLEKEILDFDIQLVIHKG